METFNSNIRIPLEDRASRVAFTNYKVHPLNNYDVQRQRQHNDDDDDDDDDDVYDDDDDDDDNSNDDDYDDRTIEEGDEDDILNHLVSLPSVKRSTSTMKSNLRTVNEFNVVYARVDVEDYACT
ncbi:hypothetical protein HZH68_009402 [Vespula germanica]|uniref:Uncharacterized protein n=1 Tax=Vespula germanica TaxID=30212 RepID=A0A834JX84_VESGE|nr:hypothetical protein HZH68_009402 [Vespula germanica]